MIWNMTTDLTATGDTLTVCAWCGRVAATRESADSRPWATPSAAQERQIADGRRVSHGICDACEADFEAGVDRRGPVLD
jgi:cytochrome c5